MFPICLLELLALHTDNKDKLRRLICITFTVAMDVHDNFINYPFGCTQTVRWSGNFREYAQNFEKQPSLVRMSFIWWWNKSALSEKLTIDTWSLNSGGENRKRVLVVSIFNSLKGLWREHVQMKRNVVSLSCREFCNTNLILLVFSESLQLIRPLAGPKSNSLGWSGWMCVCVCLKLDRLYWPSFWLDWWSLTKFAPCATTSYLFWKRAPAVDANHIIITCSWKINVAFRRIKFFCVIFIPPINFRGREQGRV